MVEYTAKGMSAARQSCEQGSTMGQDGYPTTVTPSLGSDPLRPVEYALRNVNQPIAVSTYELEKMGLASPQVLTDGLTKLLA